MDNHDYKSDHDLLIRIDTKLGLLIDQFHTHKEATIREIALINEHKADKVDIESLKKANALIVKDQEDRLRRIERIGAVAIGAIMVIQAVLGIKLF